MAAGGGGVPVMQDVSGMLEGVDAVIDKDRASALLAGLIGADVLVIITQVDRVYANFGTPEQEALEVLGTERAAAMLAAGEFPAGSMGPKIESALTFIEQGRIDWVLNVPKSFDRDELTNDYLIRRHTVDYGATLFTNIQAAILFVDSITTLDPDKDLLVKRWSEYG